MTPAPSSLWQTSLPDNIEEQLHRLLTEICQPNKKISVFFRADDIGRIDAGFIPLMELFNRHGIPLCPALVPAWLSRENWKEIRSLVETPENFCWHQHGYAHVNHAVSGKKK